MTGSDLRQQKKPVPRYTPRYELVRYGLRRAFPLRWLIPVAATSFATAAYLPWGDPGSTIFDVLASVHVTMAGFGLTVFGFTILGGKDDFFEPVMESMGKKGLDALRDLVLVLFVPVLGHGLALILCIVRKSDALFHPDAAKYAWRFIYGCVALWSAGESYESMHQLFRIAVTRLVWRYKEITKAPDGGPGTDGKATQLSAKCEAEE